MSERTNEQIKEEILDRLEMVTDPELGVDIVNLGLVYAIDLTEDGICVVSMTLTTMGCPLTDLLADLVTNALGDVEEIKKVDVKFIWEPRLIQLKSFHKNPPSAEAIKIASKICTNKTRNLKIRSLVLRIINPD